MTAERLALLGHPVGHSRSPAMMRAAFRATGIDGEYTAFDVPGELLGDAVRGLAALGFLGANITLPHKVTVMPHLASIDGAAVLVGAVNTLARVEDGFMGYNTDVEGVVRTLEGAGCDLRDARVVVIGSGGAARAAAVGCAWHGASRVDIVAREESAARAVAGAVRGLCDASWVAFGEADAALAGCDVVIQATSCGMLGGPPAADMLRDVPLARCRKRTFALDVVYVPVETPWLADARRCGLRVVERGGVEMLARQGAAAFERWFGGAAPLDEMREALGL